MAVIDNDLCLFFMWIFVVNGIAYVLWSAASRHLTRDLAPTPADLKSIWQSIKDHARFKHPTGEAAKRYNVLQKLAYLVVIFVLLPLVILMGLAMSPSLDALWPGWVDVFGGRQSARTLHFVAAAALDRLKTFKSLTNPVGLLVILLRSNQNENNSRASSVLHGLGG